MMAILGWGSIGAYKHLNVNWYLELLLIQFQYPRLVIKQERKRLSGTLKTTVLDELGLT